MAATYALVIGDEEEEGGGHALEEPDGKSPPSQATLIIKVKRPNVNRKNRGRILGINLHVCSWFWASRWIERPAWGHDRLHERAR